MDLGHSFIKSSQRVVDVFYLPPFRVPNRMDDPISAGIGTRGKRVTASEQQIDIVVVCPDFQKFYFIIHIRESG
jgi:hypothetical protein